MDQSDDDRRRCAQQDKEDRSGVVYTRLAQTDSAEFRKPTTTEQKQAVITSLDGLRQSLVHLGQLRRDAKVNCSVADLDNKATNKVGVNL